MWKLFRPVVDFVQELGLPNQLAVYRSALDKHHVFVERCRLDPRRSFTFRWQTEHFPRRRTGKHIARLAVREDDLLISLDRLGLGELVKPAPLLKVQTIFRHKVKQRKFVGGI